MPEAVSFWVVLQVVGVYSAPRRNCVLTTAARFQSYIELESWQKC